MSQQQVTNTCHIDELHPTVNSRSPTALPSRELGSETIALTQSQQAQRERILECLKQSSTKGWDEVVVILQKNGLTDGVDISAVKRAFAIVQTEEGVKNVLNARYQLAVMQRMGGDEESVAVREKLLVQLNSNLKILERIASASPELIDHKKLHEQLRDVAVKGEQAADKLIADNQHATDDRSWYSKLGIRIGQAAARTIETGAYLTVGNIIQFTSGMEATADFIDATRRLMNRSGVGSALGSDHEFTNSSLKSDYFKLNPIAHGMGGVQAVLDTAQEGYDGYARWMMTEKGEKLSEREWADRRQNNGMIKWGYRAFDTGEAALGMAGALATGNASTFSAQCLAAARMLGVSTALTSGTRTLQEVYNSSAHGEHFQISNVVSGTLEGVASNLVFAGSLSQVGQLVALKSFGAALPKTIQEIQSLGVERLADLNRSLKLARELGRAVDVAGATQGLDGTIQQLIDAKNPKQIAAALALLASHVGNAKDVSLGGAFNGFKPNRGLKVGDSKTALNAPAPDPKKVINEGHETTPPKTQANGEPIGTDNIIKFPVQTTPPLSANGTHEVSVNGVTGTIRVSGEGNAEYVSSPALLQERYRQQRTREIVASGGNMSFQEADAIAARESKGVVAYYDRENRRVVIPDIKSVPESERMKILSFIHHEVLGHGRGGDEFTAYRVQADKANSLGFELHLEGGQISLCKPEAGRSPRPTSDREIREYIAQNYTEEQLGSKSLAAVSEWGGAEVTDRKVESDAIRRGEIGQVSTPRRSPRSGLTDKESERNNDQRPNGRPDGRPARESGEDPSVSRATDRIPNGRPDGRPARESGEDPSVSRASDRRPNGRPRPRDALTSLESDGGVEHGNIRKAEISSPQPNGRAPQQDAANSNERQSNQLPTTAGLAPSAISATSPKEGPADTLPASIVAPAGKLIAATDTAQDLKNGSLYSPSASSELQMTKAREHLISRTQLFAEAESSLLTTRNQIEKLRSELTTATETHAELRAQIESDPSPIRRGKIAQSIRALNLLVQVGNDCSDLIGRGTKEANTWLMQLNRSLQEKGISGARSHIAAGQSDPETAMGKNFAGKFLARVTGDKTSEKFKDICARATLALDEFNSVATQDLKNGPLKLRSESDRLKLTEENRLRALMQSNERLEDSKWRLNQQEELLRRAEVDIGIAERDLKRAQGEVSTLEAARSILSRPHRELREMPINQRFRLIESLCSSHPTTPDEILNAEARILSTYEPSQNLKNIHSNAVAASLEKVGEAKLHQWETDYREGNPERKIQILQEWTNALSEAYGMQALEVFASQLPARIVAHYQPFGMGRLGEIAVDHSSIGQSLSAGLAILAHETSHAYQDALVMGLVTTSPEVAQDVAWFSIQKAREAVRPPELFIRSELRYLSLPTEIDAWTMQEDAEQKIGLRLGSNPI